MPNNAAPDYLNPDYDPAIARKERLVQRNRGRHFRPNLAPAQSRLKRQIDIIGAVIGLITFAPLMAAIYLAVKWGGGSAFYAHQRIGVGGKAFPCLKFRTMVPDAAERLQHILATDPLALEEWQQSQKLRNDPRITRVGQFLRKTSLDELPQFINVLRGEMSLVGPRPITEEEIERYGTRFNDYASCRPGMSGIWQVSGRNSVDYQGRVLLDSKYAKSWNLWLDVKILFRTVGILWEKTGH